MRSLAASQRLPRPASCHHNRSTAPVAAARRLLRSSAHTKHSTPEKRAWPRGAEQRAPPPTVRPRDASGSSASCARRRPAACPGRHPADGRRHALSLPTSLRCPTSGVGLTRGRRDPRCARSNWFVRRVCGHALLPLWPLVERAGYRPCQSFRCVGHPGSRPARSASPLRPRFKYDTAVPPRWQIRRLNATRPGTLCIYAVAPAVSSGTATVTPEEAINPVARRIAASSSVSCSSSAAAS